MWGHCAEKVMNNDTINERSRSLGAVCSSAKASVSPPEGILFAGTSDQVGVSASVVRPRRCCLQVPLASVCLESRGSKQRNRSRGMGKIHYEQGCDAKILSTLLNANAANPTTQLLHRHPGEILCSCSVYKGATCPTVGRHSDRDSPSRVGQFLRVHGAVAPTEPKVLLFLGG